MFRRSYSGDRRGTGHLFIPFRCNITANCEALILAPASHLEWAVEAVIEQNNE